MELSVVQLLKTKAKKDILKQAKDILSPKVQKLDSLAEATGTEINETIPPRLKENNRQANFSIHSKCLSGMKVKIKILPEKQK